MTGRLAQAQALARERELFRSHGAGGQASQMALAPAALTKQSGHLSTPGSGEERSDLSRPWAEEGLGPAFCPNYTVPVSALEILCNEGAVSSSVAGNDIIES